MTAYHRPLARLPLEVFEPFVGIVAPLPSHHGSDEGCSSSRSGVVLDLAGDDREQHCALARPHQEDGDRATRHLWDSTTVDVCAPQECALEQQGGDSFGWDAVRLANLDEGCGASAVTMRAKRRRLVVGGREDEAIKDMGETRVVAATTPTTKEVDEIRRRICSELVAASAAAPHPSRPMHAVVASRVRDTEGADTEGDQKGAAAAAAASRTKGPTARGDNGGATDNDDDEEHCFNDSARTGRRGEGTARTDARSGPTMVNAPASSASSITTIRTVGQLLGTDAHDLMRKLDPLLTAGECQLLLQRVASHCAPPAASAWSLLQKLTPPAPRASGCRFVSTCIPVLDKNLRGGIEVGRIFEVYGASGTGKTQFCLTAAVQNVIDHRSATLYIRTTSASSEAGPHPRPPSESSGLVVERLREIATHRLASRGSASSAITTSTVLSNIVTHTVGDAEELLQCIDSLEEEIVMRSQDREGGVLGPEDCALGTENPDELPINLIVLDSLAQPLLSASLDQEGEGSAGPRQLNPSRAAFALAVAQRLKRIALEHRIAVVVVNHVDMVQGTYGGGEAAEVDGLLPSAALGTAWHHCVSTRVALQHRPIPIPSTEATVLPMSTSARQPPSSTSPLVFDRTVVLTKSSVVPCPAGPFDFAVLAPGVAGAG